MKKFHNFFLVLLAIFVVDYSFEDSNGDRSKELITIHYSNKQEDVLTIDKNLVDTPKMYEALDKIAQKRIESGGK